MNIIDRVNFPETQYQAYYDCWRKYYASHSRGFHFSVNAGRNETADRTEFSFSLPAELSEKLMDLSDGNDTAAFTILVCAAAILFKKYTGENDIILHTPFYINDLVTAEKEGIVPLCLTIQDESSFLATLQACREVIREVYTHQDFPLVLLEYDQAGPSSLNSNILFRYSGLHSNVAVDTPYDMVWDFTSTDNMIQISVSCVNDLMDKVLEDHLPGHFSEILKCLSDLHQPVGSISPLTDNELQQVLYDFNATDKYLTSFDNCWDLFEKQTVLYADRIAVMDIDKTVSYQALHKEALQIAGQLDIKQGDAVAVIMERSATLIAAILAIWKAGGVYVPVDPAYPSERKELLLSSAAVLLTSSDMLFALPVFNGKIVCADIQEETAIAITTDITPESNAYCIYTSGSTGKPKGVLISHQSCLNTVLDHITRFAIAPQDKVLQFASPSFDVSVCEILMAVLSGASLMIPADQLRTDPAGLTAWMKGKGVTIAMFTASFYNLIEPEQLDFLRVLVTGGESPNSNRAARAVALSDYYNAYGPTECCICSTIHRVTTTDLIPIGKPIANTHIYILDDQLMPVPVSIKGEVFIGGTGVMKGYAGEEALTAEKIITIPGLENERLYRSGDLAKWLPDGNIVFLGRADDQVKIRGFRVEPEETDMVVQQHSAVQNAFTMAVDNNAEQSLITYITLDKTAAYTAARVLQLRNSNFDKYSLLYTLPNGMIVTPAGKTEADLLYREIFEEHCYLQHHITINKGDVILDIGANIGMFSLYAGLNVPSVKVYAFEPVPEIYELLTENIALYDINVTALNIGLSDKEETVVFNYYPNNTAFSSRYSDAAEEKKTVSDFVVNQFAAASVVLDDTQLNSIVENKLIRKEVSCQLRRLSDVIRENNITVIDLLKIDAEKGEWDILNGILPEDWPRIKQLVIEVHDTDDRLAMISNLLKEKGFIISVDQSAEFEHSLFYNVYACRTVSQETAAPFPALCFGRDENKWNDFTELLKDIRAFAKQHLPEYMVPAEFRIVKEMPLGSNGKTDRTRLEIMEADFTNDREFLEPRNEIEQQLTNAWSGILDRTRISVQDNFFDLGGNSFKVIKLLDVLNGRFDNCLKVGDLFDQSTIEKQALLILDRTTAVSKDHAGFDVINF